jgi:hypothetical protein
MSYIKEPKGVDFIIQSPPYTEQERKAISEFIRKQKEKAKLDLPLRKPKRNSKVSMK